MNESTAFAIATQAALDGELLGDGSLFVGKRYTNAKFQLQTVYEGQARFADSSLQELEGKTVSFVRKVSGFRTRPTTMWMYGTKRTELLTEQWRRWYPDSFKKVPRDFVLTSVSALHWYIGDGSLHPENPRVVLCTDNFDTASIERLCEQLEVRNFWPKIRRTSKGHLRIELGVDDVANWLDFVGPCPIPELAHKWRPAFRQARLRQVRPAEKKEILKLRNEGFSYSDIANKLERSTAGIWKVCRHA